MSSILTNTSSMVALQTLKGINSNLQKVQSEISTGKSVNSAKDNAALWAISKVMESDVAGFKAVSESLALGDSSVAVARNASETVTDLLTDIKSKVIAAQESNVDREKIQTDIGQLTDQIKAVTGAAQFNGLNLVEGTEDVDILASLDRDSSGGVNDSKITIARQDLTTGAGQDGTTAATSSGYATISSNDGVAGGKTSTAASPTAITGGDTVSQNTNATAGENLTIAVATPTAGETYSVTIGGKTASFLAANTNAADIRDGLIANLNALGIEGATFAASGSTDITVSNTNAFETLDVSTTQSSDPTALVIDNYDGNGTANADFTSPVNSLQIDQRATSVDFSATATVNEGDTFQIQVGTAATFSYTAGKGESMEDVARGLKIAADSQGVAEITAEVQDNNGTASLAIDYDGSPASLTFSVTTGGTASGGLFGLENLDVTTDAGAAAALDNIETLIQSSIDAAAEFGSVAGRIETQSDFISKLTDSLKSGIGTLVDADMEEASARLQALQVQQQLGVQSLSIANQAPQSLLSLFR